MSNTYLTNIEAAKASLGWALAQTAHSKRVRSTGAGR